jgi:glutathione synthase/RimK-type ligase-like ATP-grasp enzyme
MGDLGVFVDRQVMGSSEQLTALIRLRDQAEAMGHTVYFIFPVEVRKVARVDGLFIRSRTDPMHISYVAAKLAAFHGIPVIDDPVSIQVCSDKVNMYLHLMKGHVRIPETRFLSKQQITRDGAEEVFASLGSPVILKEPSTSFSLRVEKVETTEEFVKVARRFIKLSDWIVAQQYLQSIYDWRIGVLDGKLLYAAQYIIPSETFKIQDTVDGHLVYCAVRSMPETEVPGPVIETGLAAARAIGRGLYGVDIKECDGVPYVIEVNDNPSLEGGEDEHYPDLYRRVVAALVGEGQG